MLSNAVFTYFVTDLHDIQAEFTDPTGTFSSDQCLALRRHWIYFVHFTRVLWWFEQFKFEVDAIKGNRLHLQMCHRALRCRDVLFEKPCTLTCTRTTSAFLSFQNNRSQITYDPLSEQLRYDLKSQVQRYLEGTLDQLEVWVNSVWLALLSLVCRETSSRTELSFL